MSEELNRLPRVIDKTGLSRSTIYSLIARGEFPAPIRLGTRAVAWPASQVDQWIKDRIAASRGGAQ